MTSLSSDDYTVLAFEPVLIEEPIEARMTFYTTAEMEQVWGDAYASAITEKQAELDARQHLTKILEKYTAYAYVYKPVRVFHVAEDGVIACGGAPCPPAPVPGGSTYTLDPTFRVAVARFQRLHSTYSVEFRPSGIDVCMNYCSVGMPATMRSADGDSLVVEDEQAYDIGVL
jgi:hypothetical protein